MLSDPEGPASAGPVSVGPASAGPAPESPPSTSPPSLGPESLRFLFASRDEGLRVVEVLEVDSGAREHAPRIDAF